MTTIRTMLSCVALGGLLFVDGCSLLRQANASPSAPMEGQLAAALQQAETEVLASRFGVADRLLADFAERHPNAPENVEVAFWRALFKLDPANQTAGPRDAIALLDAYLSARQTVAHRGAATSLRRVAVALDRGPPAVAASPTSSPAATGARVDEKAYADEVQRLKEELAKANAELERIKRRVAPPKP
jgi:hypothetical protein